MNNRLETSIQGIRGAHLMRKGALSHLTDSDLDFSPGGDNLRLGALLKSFGETQYSYIQSFKTYHHDWTYHHPANNLESNINELSQWLGALDKEMKDILQTISENDLQKTIDRGNDVIRTIEQQIEIYIQAFMIFLGKLVIYFKAMSIDLPPSMQHYID